MTEIIQVCLLDFNKGQLTGLPKDTVKTRIRMGYLLLHRCVVIKEMICLPKTA